MSTSQRHWPTASTMAHWTTALRSSLIPCHWTANCMRCPGRRCWIKPSVWATCPIRRAPAGCTSMFPARPLETRWTRRTTPLPACCPLWSATGRNCYASPAAPSGSWSSGLPATATATDPVRCWNTSRKVTAAATPVSTSPTWTPLNFVCSVGR